MKRKNSINTKQEGNYRKNDCARQKIRKTEGNEMTKYKKHCRENYTELELKIAENDGRIMEKNLAEVEKSIT